MSSAAISTSPPGDPLNTAFGKINDAFDATTREILMGVAVGWNTAVTGDPPEEIMHSNGTRRLRETVSYADGWPESIAYHRSGDGGTTWTHEGTLTFVYQGGVAVAANWT